MDDKDMLKEELKSIMEEESKDIYLSSEIIESILANRKKGLLERIDDFLNREIEITLTPVIIGVTCLFLLLSFPKGIFINQDIKIIDIGSSKVIISQEEAEGK